MPDLRMTLRTILAQGLVGVQFVCMMVVFHIETFVTFDFDPSLISRLITDSDLDQIK